MKPDWELTPRIRPGFPGQQSGPHHTDVKIPGGKGPVNVRDIFRYSLAMTIANFNTSGLASFVCNYNGASRPSDNFQIYCGIFYDLGEYGLRPGGREIHFARPTGTGNNGQTGVVYPVAVRNGNLYLPRQQALRPEDYQDPVAEYTPDEAVAQAQPSPWKAWSRSANARAARRGEREIKVKNPAEMAGRAGNAAALLLRLVLAGVNAATETADLIWAVYWALPYQYRGPDSTPVEAAERIWANWQHINVGKALYNIGKNQLEDAFYGAAGQGWQKYRRAVWDKYGVDIGSQPGSLGFGGLGLGG